MIRLGAKITKIVGIQLIASFLAVSFSYGAGTSSAQFLKLGAGARAAAMGEAFTAVADDVTAAYWNPAGLTQIKSPEISLMHNDHLVGSQYQYLGAALPVGSNFLGVSLYRLDFGSIDGYTAADVKNGSFDAGSFAGSLSWAKPFGERLNFGVTAKYIQSSIENEKATSFAADLGFLYEIQGYKVGLALQHLGPQMKFVQEEEDLPQTIRGGVSHRYFQEALLLSLDFSKPRDNDMSLHGGLEYNLNPMFSLRSGYKLTPGNNIDVDGVTNVSAGLGINLSKFTFDYAFVPFGDLGDTHRISFLFRFANN